MAKQDYTFFDPAELGIMSVMAVDEPSVVDLRTDENPSLALVPRINNYAELQQYFGVSVNRSKGWDICPVGQWCWKLYEYSVRTGSSGFISQFYKADGSPYEGVRVASTWPTAPLAPGGEQLVPDYAYQTNHGVAGWTNANGDIGQTIDGAHIGIGGPGPIRIWPMIPAPPNQPQYADGSFGHGWIVNTDHLLCSGRWRLTLKTESSPTPPPPTNGADTYVAILEKDGIAVARKVYEPLTAAGGYKEVLFKGTERLGEIPWENL